MKRTLGLTLFLLLLPALAVAAPRWIRYDSAHFGIFFVEREIRSATAFAKSAEELRTRVVKAFGEFDEKIIVYLAPDRETYNELQPRDHIPEWSVGTAFPAKATIIMFSPTGALVEGLHGDNRQVFIHELAHVALFQVLGGRHAPNWLDEGLAQFVAREWQSTDSVRLTVALLFDGLIPLSELTTHWPRGGSRAKLAYAQSLSLVIYLNQRRDLLPLLAALADGQNSARAVRSATGLAPSVFEKRWRRYLERRHTWLSVLNTRCIWSASGLLAVFGYFIFRRRQRRKYARLDDDMYAPNKRDEPRRLRRGLRLVKKEKPPDLRH
jgi:Peptidase MA superfamily